MNHRGKFIVFEGLDGCGKTTQQSLLESRLASNAIPYTHSVEPTNSVMGSAFRRAISSENKNDISEDILSGLILLDRMNNVTGDKGLKAVLDDGYYVVQSRYCMSTYAYNVTPTTPKWVKAMYSDIQSMLKPDMYIYIDISPEVAVERIKARGEKMDVYEQVDKLRHVRDRYLKYIDKTDELVFVVDGTNDFKSLSDVIWEKVKGLYKIKEPDSEVEWNEIR